MLARMKHAKLEISRVKLMQKLRKPARTQVALLICDTTLYLSTERLVLKLNAALTTHNCPTKNSKRKLTIGAIVLAIT